MSPVRLHGLTPAATAVGLTLLGGLVIAFPDRSAESTKPVPLVVSARILAGQPAIAPAAGTVLVAAAGSQEVQRPGVGSDPASDPQPASSTLPTPHEPATAEQPAAAATAALPADAATTSTVSGSGSDTGADSGSDSGTDTGTDTGSSSDSSSYSSSGFSSWSTSRSGSWSTGRSLQRNGVTRVSRR